MRILFATTRGAGHFGPLIPFAHACRRAGHQLLVAGPSAAEPLAERAGLSFTPLGEASPERLDRVRESLRSVPLEQAIELAARDLFVRCHAAAALPDMLEVVDGWRPHLIVRETAEFSSCVAAEALGVPQARVGIALTAPYEDWCLDLAAPALDELRDGLGIDPDPGAERARRTPCFTLAPRALEDPATPAPATVRRFRAPAGDDSAPLPDWWNGRDDPLVYVSFGTVVPTEGFYPGLYREVVDALAELPARVLVTIGQGQDPAALGSLPPSVHVERWVPQAAVLSQAAAMVGHGGAGTTLGALAAGVPMVLLPLFADQPLNAQRVAGYGAGVALEGGPAAVSGLGAAVGVILEEPRYRAAAGRVAEEIGALPAVDEAVYELTALAGDPVLSA